MSNNNFKMTNLKKLREEKNITQTRLSIEIEVSQEIISHYEIGDSKPNVDNLIKIADFFHCSTDYLLNRTNNPSINGNNDNNEINDIIYKYNSLNDDKKTQLKSFLNYLTNLKE